MNEAQRWINDRNRSYKEGLRIYNQHKISNKHDLFFNSVLDPAPSEPQYQILYIQMVKIARKLGNTPPPTQVRKIEIKTIATNDAAKNMDLGALHNNKQFVNKLLALGWENLTEGDKNLFFDNQDYYLAKQKLLFEISELKENQRLVDVKRKETKKQADRKKFNEQFGRLADKIKAKFNIIDTWELPKASSENKNDAKEAVERERQIRYLKGTALPRAKKELVSGKLTEKQKKARVEKIAEWEKQLAELEKIHTI